jgi:hypothetical protein
MGVCRPVAHLFGQRWPRCSFDHLTMMKSVEAVEEV